jgi:hypothetical protein
VRLQPYHSGPHDSTFSFAFPIDTDDILPSTVPRSTPALDPGAAEAGPGRGSAGGLSPFCRAFCLGAHDPHYGGAEMVHDQRKDV